MGQEKGRVSPGLRQAMSTFGALIGATVAGLAFRASGQNYILTFALSTIPAAAALALTISVSAHPETNARCILVSMLGFWCAAT